MPYHWVIVSPGNDFDIVGNGKFNHLFGRILEYIGIVEVLDLRSLPVLTIRTGHHAADIAQAQDARPWHKVIDRLGFYTLLGCRHGFTEIEGMKSTVDVAPDFTKSHLASLGLTMSWAKVTDNFIALFVGVPVHGYSRVFFPIHVIKV
jgi:hypothetical protein